MSTEEQDIKIVLDVETTGLDYKREKIIEFAAVKLVNNVITEEFETLINPQQEIKASSMSIHNISEEMVADAPTMAEVLPQILDFIKDYPLIGHNVIFDYSFLNRATEEIYGKTLQNHRIDTYLIYKEVFPDDPSHGLESLMNRFSIEFPVRHRAMADTKALAYVYPHLKSFYDKKRTWQLSQLGNIEYLLERYLRIQQAVQTMQAELADIKSIFKVHFEESGREIKATSGETLTSYIKPTYSYKTSEIKQIIDEIGLHEKAFRLNNGFIERLINDSSTSNEVRQRLMACRIKMNESKSVTIQKPEKNTYAASTCEE
jgi:DNA polymerase-3 subunit alpha (Gram-positive type)